MYSFFLPFVLSCWTYTSCYPLFCVPTAFMRFFSYRHPISSYLPQYNYGHSTWPHWGCARCTRFHDIYGINVQHVFLPVTVKQDLWGCVCAKRLPTRAKLRRITSVQQRHGRLLEMFEVLSMLIAKGWLLLGVVQRKRHLTGLVLQWLEEMNDVHWHTSSKRVIHLPQPVLPTSIYMSVTLSLSLRGFEECWPVSLANVILHSTTIARGWDNKDLKSSLS